MNIQIHGAHIAHPPGYLLKLNTALNLAGHYMVNYGFVLSTSPSKLLFNPEQDSSLISSKCTPYESQCMCSPHKCYWAYKDYKHRVMKIMVGMMNEAFDFSTPGVKCVTFYSNVAMGPQNPLFLALQQKGHSPQFAFDLLQGLNFKMSLNSELCRIWIKNGGETTRVDVCHPCSACNVFH